MRIQIVREGSKFRFYWSLFLVILIVLSAVIIPFQIGFQPVDSAQISVLIHLIELYFMLDVGLNFFTSYRSNGIEIKDLHTINHHYLKTFFAIDLIASFPLDVIFSFFPDITVSGISLILLLRGLKLLRIVTFFKIFAEWEIKSWSNAGLLRIIKFFITIILLIHWVACIWFLAAFLDHFPPEAWVVRFDLVQAAPIQQYLYALYWAVTTMTTVGYGDITPNRPIEYVLSIAVMLLGASMYAFIIGNIASLFSNLDAAKAEHKNRVEGVTRFLRYRQVDPDLVDRIVDYYQYIWSRHRGMNSEHLFQDLPLTLRLDLMRSITIDLLDKVPLFNSSPTVLQGVLLRSLQLHTYSPDTCIAQEGEVGETIFFISQGSVEVTSSENPDFRCILTEGEYFGDLSLLLSERRTGTVKTLVYCEIFTLSKHDFNHIRAQYPELKEVLKTISSKKSEKMMHLLLAGITL